MSYFTFGSLGAETLRWPLISFPVANDKTLENSGRFENLQSDAGKVQISVFSQVLFFLLWPFLEGERRVVRVLFRVVVEVIVHPTWHTSLPHRMRMSPVSACHVFLFMRFCKYYIAVFRWLAMWGGLIISEAYTHSDIEFVMASFFNLSWLKNSNAQIFKKCRCFSLVSCIERHTCWFNMSSVLEEGRV